MFIHSFKRLLTALYKSIIIIIIGIFAQFTFGFAALFQNGEQ